MFELQLQSTARALVAAGKGILAADESAGTIEKRFKDVGVPATEQNRQAYRDLLFSTSGLGEFISGAILFDETIRQKATDGLPMIEKLKAQNILPGIKVDKGTSSLAGFAGENVTDGLDGLRERLVEYRSLGARFTKWRAVIKLGAALPSEFCLRANAYSLARFAALSQESGLVPIVEPEVLMDGDHTIERHAEVTELAIRLVFDALAEHRVLLEGMLLKPNMVLPGKASPQRNTVEEVAEATTRVMLRVVPAAVPGLVFLSGGQSDAEATAHLSAMNQTQRWPWELSFSFGRALQSAALNKWRGDAANATSAQQALYHRAQCNSLARFGGKEIS